MLSRTSGEPGNAAAQLSRCGKSGIVCGNGDDFADRDVGGCRSQTAVGEEAEHYSQCTLRTQFTVRIHAAHKGLYLNGFPRISIAA